MAPWQRYVPAPSGTTRDLDTSREFARGKDVIISTMSMPTDFLHTLMAEGVNVNPPGGSAVRTG